MYYDTTYRTNKKLTRNLTHFLFLCLMIIFTSGCGKEQDKSSQNDVTTEKTVSLTAWAHHGKPEEWKVIREMVTEFNQSQKRINIKLVEIAEGNYDTQVQSAAVSDELPDILEFDGPMLANYVWKGYLKPLDQTIPDSTLSRLLPSVIEQGSYRGRFYATGIFDSGLALFANLSLLNEVNARIPQGIGDAWSIHEFNDLLHSLSERSRMKGREGYAIDIKRDYRGEWWTYGFYPALISGRAALIDTSDYRSANGVLNSESAVNVMKNFQDWMIKGYLAPNTDGRAFVDGRAALSWVGHWEYPRYREALGERLILVPLPDFGMGTRTAMGSWCWGLTRHCQHIMAASEFLEFTLQDPQVLSVTRANGAVPGTMTAIAASELYQPGAPLHLYVEQLESCAVPRAKTPAYPVITSAFQEAMLNIFNGADIQSELDKAVGIIDEDIRQNQGYRFPERSESQ
jgi:multiple sugar transport system substrate-binding protein